MFDGIKIEWMDVIVNVINGCSVILFGCMNCYVMWLVGIWMCLYLMCVGLIIDIKVGLVWNGQVCFNEKVLMQVLLWIWLCMIFWNVYGDLFYESVFDEWIDCCFVVMVLML